MTNQTQAKPCHILATPLNGQLTSLYRKKLTTWYETSWSKGSFLYKETTCYVSEKSLSHTVIRYVVFPLKITQPKLMVNVSRKAISYFVFSNLISTFKLYYKILLNNQKPWYFLKRYIQSDYITLHQRYSTSLWLSIARPHSFHSPWKNLHLFKRFDLWEGSQQVFFQLLFHFSRLISLHSSMHFPLH